MNGFYVSNLKSYISIINYIYNYIYINKNKSYWFSCMKQIVYSYDKILKIKNNEIKNN